MTCASCSQIIEDNTKTLSGVESVQVNFATEKADIKFNDQFSEDSFKSLLEKLGYRAADEKADKKDDQFFNEIFYQSLAAVLIGSFLMGISMGPLSSFFEHSTSNIIQLILASVVLFSLGLPYLKSVVKFVTSGYSNMNTLIGLGVLASYLYSIYLMIDSAHAHVYFETIPFIIGFTMFGHFLDEKAKTKARASLSSLYKMQIKFAIKVVDGKEINTPVIELKSGDIIRLKPGEKIPLDGVVIQGETHTDESMITGESVPVAKRQGENVFAGSLNLEGSIQVQIKEELHQTYIANIVSFVEKAQLKKAPIQKYADRIVRVFVPVIIAISLITFIAWFLLGNENRSAIAMSHMIAVLVIACPCALGLAVPMAVMLSTAEASKAGLLISGGEVIEKASSIDVMVFDKTGTLTEGRPIVSEFKTSLNSDEFLKIAGSVVQYSNHPLSAAITKYIETKKIKLADPDAFKNLPGMGMESTLFGKKILIGKKELLENAGIKVDDIEIVGSLVYIGIDQIFAGVFVIEDPIKATAVQTVRSLMKKGIEVWMLTGDNILIAKKIAAEIGISNVKANVLPVDKANFIMELKQSGKKVAMIGDGINDAPALSSADLGMAMASGSDVAIEAAEVSILEGKIECVATFFELSNKTMRVIKENLFLSSFYNLLCIPLAAGAFAPWLNLSLTPMWASLAMGLSSVSVVLSSLRLKKSL